MFAAVAKSVDSRTEAASDFDYSVDNPLLASMRRMMQMTAQIREPEGTFTEPDSSEMDHAALAMQAAKKVRRARRQSQKEKMGHEVCHHLMCLLEGEPEPTPREKRLAAASSAENLEANPLAMKAADDRQMSMAF